MNAGGQARWRPSSFLKASALAHLGAAAALAWPESRMLGVATLLANHAALTFAGLWPRSTLLGPNVLHLDRSRPQVALTIDDGPDPQITPAVLDLLDRHQAKATFFCIAAKVQAHPALAREIVARGHRIENHSMHHRHHFSLMGLAALENELRQAQQAIADVTGRLPRYFRAPAGLRNPFLDPVLHRLDLQLVSWTRRGFDTRERDAGKVLARLTAGAQAGDIVLLHDANAARTAGGQPVILDVLPPLIERFTGAGLRFVTLDQGLAPLGAAPLDARPVQASLSESTQCKP